MAKSQKRTNKETRKVKDPRNKGKTGPKYLREGEVLQVGKLGAHRPGQKH